MKVRFRQKHGQVYKTLGAHCLLGINLPFRRALGLNMTENKRLAHGDFVFSTDPEVCLAVESGNCYIWSNVKGPSWSESLRLTGPHMQCTPEFAWSVHGINHTLVRAIWTTIDKNPQLEGEKPHLLISGMLSFQWRDLPIRDLRLAQHIYIS